MPKGLPCSEAACTAPLRDSLALLPYRPLAPFPCPSLFVVRDSTDVDAPRSQTGRSAGAPCLARGAAPGPGQFRTICADHPRARRAQSADRRGQDLSRGGQGAHRHRGVDRRSHDRSRDARRAELEQEIRVALLPKDAMDDRNVVLEIRAGTGGDEASLFAGDLFRMYERFASLQGWKVEVISASEGTMGGYKEIIAEVRGRGAFAKLKFESGVHRVQRVPDTETQGRIHTSA